MITTFQAEELIARCELILVDESIPIEQALHRILAEDLFADTDLPPFNRVMMDGIALNYKAIENGQRSFTIQAMQRAGEAPHTLKSEHNCIEIMTGGVCSFGCDTVVPYEHIRIDNGVAHVEVIPQESGKNVHLAGSDKRRGDILATKGIQLGPAEIGIAASIGKEKLMVKSLPRVLICSTGDELVEIEATPLAHQIRRSNVYALRSFVQTLGIQADLVHLTDDSEKLRGALTRAVTSYDVILLSGGVSKGKFDLLPDVLTELGITTIFHGIAQRPGKPMWFGKSDQCVVFALPGNPVSTLACAARYVMPWFKAQLGFSAQPAWVALHTEPKAHEKLSLFLPVKIRYSETGILAHAMTHQGSGDFSALIGMDGFVEVRSGELHHSLYRYFPV